MSTLTPAAPPRRSAGPRRNKAQVRAAVAGAVLVALFVAMGLDTAWVKNGSAADVVPGTFSPLAFGQKEFPVVQKAVEGRAVAAPILAAAIAKDPDAAAKQYGVATGVGVEYAVSFTGVLGDGDFGNYDVKIPDMPSDVKVSLQTGPAIMGTDLRDVTGTIQFGQFTNQIDYQNAGAALNKQMKTEVLSKVDTTALKGKTVTVVGAFLLSDPTTWLVTPVSLQVKG